MYTLGEIFSMKGNSRNILCFQKEKKMTSGCNAQMLSLLCYAMVQANSIHRLKYGLFHKRKYKTNKCAWQVNTVIIYMCLTA